MSKTPTDPRHPDTPVTEHVAKHRDRVRTLGYELDQVIKLLAHARECVENELYQGMGHKKLGITDKDMAKVNMLARSLETAVSAKVRFDKAQKDMVDEMTTAEQFEAAVDYVRSLDSNDITYFITRVHDKTRVR